MTTDGENSADDLSKSEEISLNRSNNTNDSPNFTDTYNAWRKFFFNLSKVTIGFLQNNSD